MSNVYYLLAAISYGIFLVQFILSWFGGDTDLDVDLDGELDMWCRWLLHEGLKNPRLEFNSRRSHALCVFHGKYGLNGSRE